MTDRDADRYKRLIKHATNIYIYIHVWCNHSLLSVHKLTASQFSRVMIINAPNHVMTLSRNYVYSEIHGAEMDEF